MMDRIRVWNLGSSWRAWMRSATAWRDEIAAALVPDGRSSCHLADLAPALGSQVGSHSSWTCVDSCGRWWNRKPSVPGRADTHGRLWTRLGDLRIRRLGVRVPPGVLLEPMWCMGFVVRRPHRWGTCGSRFGSHPRREAPFTGAERLDLRPAQDVPIPSTRRNVRSCSGFGDRRWWHRQRVRVGVWFGIVSSSGEKSWQECWVLDTYRGVGPASR